MYLFNLIIIANIIKAFAIPSGLYLDNGHGKTVLEEFSSMKEKIQFEREMLNILGITRKPRRSFNTTSLSTSASKYLMEVYKIIKKMEITNQFNLNRDDIRTIQESDAILTFSPRVHKDKKSQKKQSRKLWFEMKSDIPEAHMISNGELRIYKHDECFVENKFYQIKAEQITVDYRGERLVDLVDTIDTTSDYQGWLVFNITSTLFSWLAVPAENGGVKISVYESSTKNSTRAKKIAPETIGVVTSQSKPEIEPLVIVFLTFDTTKPRRPNRDITKRTRKNERESNPFVPEPEASWRNCQMQTLYVDFKDLKWDNWIIAPNGYAAYYCHGLCKFPAIGTMNATNHAIIQTLMNFLDPESVPSACCAPSKLSPLSVIYYLEDGGVLLKNFRDMIIEGCSCQ